MEDAGQHTRETLEDLYREIAEVRMEGIPILNDALSVAAFGFEPFQNFRLGVLLTPWFMNLMLIPIDGQKFSENPPKVGEKMQLSLPAGQIEFIVGYEEKIGYSLSCSLFSPMFEFEDQVAAVETAKAALAEVMSDDCEIDDDDADMRDIWAGRLPEAEFVDEDCGLDFAQEVPDIQQPRKDVSRRDLFRGLPSQESSEVQPEDQP